MSSSSSDTDSITDWTLVSRDDELDTDDDDSSTDSSIEVVSLPDLSSVTDTGGGASGLSPRFILRLSSIEPDTSDDSNEEGEETSKRPSLFRKNFSSSPKKDVDQLYPQSQSLPSVTVTEEQPQQSPSSAESISAGYEEQIAFVDEGRQLPPVIDEGRQLPPVIDEGRQLPPVFESREEDVQTVGDLAKSAGLVRFEKDASESATELPEMQEREEKADEAYADAKVVDVKTTDLSDLGLEGIQVKEEFVTDKAEPGLSPPEDHVDHEGSMASSISSQFSFLHREQEDSGPVSDDDTESVHELDNEGDRTESEQSVNDVGRDMDNYSDGTDVNRQYVHQPNRQLGLAVDLIALLLVALAALFIGHAIGSSRIHYQYQENQELLLNEVERYQQKIQTSKNEMESVWQKEQESKENEIRKLKRSYQLLQHQSLTYREQAEMEKGERIMEQQKQNQLRLMNQHLKEEANQLRIEVADLRSEVSRLKYQSPPTGDLYDVATETALKSRVNHLEQENSDLITEIGRLRYQSHPGNSEVNGNHGNGQSSLFVKPVEIGQLDIASDTKQKQTGNPVMVEKSMPESEWEGHEVEDEEEEEVQTPPLSECDRGRREQEEGLHAPEILEVSPGQAQEKSTGDQDEFSDRKETGGKDWWWADTVMDVLNRTKSSVIIVNKQIQDTWQQVKNLSQEMWHKHEPHIHRMSEKFADKVEKITNHYSQKIQGKMSRWFNSAKKRQKRDHGHSARHKGDGDNGQEFDMKNEEAEYDWHTETSGGRNSQEDSRKTFTAKTSRRNFENEENVEENEDGSFRGATQGETDTEEKKQDENMSSFQTKTFSSDEDRNSHTQKLKQDKSGHSKNHKRKEDKKEHSKAHNENKDKKKNLKTEKANNDKKKHSDNHKRKDQKKHSEAPKSKEKNKDSHTRNTKQDKKKHHQGHRTDQSKKQKWHDNICESKLCQKKLKKLQRQINHLNRKSFLNVGFHDIQNVFYDFSNFAGSFGQDIFHKGQTWFQCQHSWLRESIAGHFDLDPDCSSKLACWQARMSGGGDWSCKHEHRESPRKREKNHKAGTTKQTKDEKPEKHRWHGARKGRKDDGHHRHHSSEKSLDVVWSEQNETSVDQEASAEDLAYFRWIFDNKGDDNDGDNNEGDAKGDWLFERAEDRKQHREKEDDWYIRRMAEGKNKYRHDEDDASKADWLFERAEDREYHRDNPDDWYFRRMDGRTSSFSQFGPRPRNSYKNHG